MKDKIRVFAPATVANVVCGYDVLGFAVHAPGDEVEMQLSDKPGLRILEITGDQGLLPMDPAKNTVSASVFNLLKALDRADQGVEIKLHKQMPIGSGLGSSSASTVAGLYAANALLGSPLTAKELVPYAMQGEALACGFGHADNVAPALMGGFVLVRSYEPLDLVSLPTPQGLYAGVLHPDVVVPTKDARQMIKSKVLLRDAVQQWGNIAGLVSGLCMSDFDLIGRSMQDVLIEPTRAILIPGFYHMREMALQMGGLGFGISGSGPSVFVLCRSEDQAAAIVHAQQQYLKTLQINSQSYVSAVNTQGPRIL